MRDRLSLTGDPSEVRTRSTAAMICGSTTALFGDWPAAQPSLPPPFDRADPARAPSRVAYWSVW